MAHVELIVSPTYNDKQGVVSITWECCPWAAHYSPIHIQYPVHVVVLGNTMNNAMTIIILSPVTPNDIIGQQDSGSHLAELVQESVNDP